MSLPTITLVTPNYNQGQYLALAIESVLRQEYPGLEYFVMDGGSTDDSVEVLEAYTDSITYWRSHPDGGQAEAVEEGFRLGSGELLCWLNADDELLPGALHRLAKTFSEDSETILSYGDYIILYPDGRQRLSRKISFDWKICLYAYLMIPQPASMWRRDAHLAVGGLNTKLRYALDYDLFLKLGNEYGSRFVHLPEPLALFRVHDSSKSVSEAEYFKDEIKRVRRSYLLDLDWRYEFQKKWQLLRTEYRFLRERHWMPISKDRSKF